jgi:hypothetical protein
VIAVTDEHADEARREAMRVALSLVRADWQGDELTWRRLWHDCPDQEALAHELVRMCRESLERLASVAGVSTGEMLHRQATRLVPSDAEWAAVGSSLGNGGSTGRHRGPLADADAAQSGQPADNEVDVDVDVDVRTIGPVRAGDEPGISPPR